MYAGEVDVVSVKDYSQVLVAEPKQKVDLTRYTEHHQFSFDYAFDETSENVFVYEVTAKPLVQFVMNGGMGTCFAFGQTGSGKTFTMLGAPEVGQPGLYLLAAGDVFRMCNETNGPRPPFPALFSPYAYLCDPSCLLPTLARSAVRRTMRDGRAEARLTAGVREQTGSRSL